ncbi:MAG: hypothetical protein QF414_07080 [Arenicellales bacterium]|nr:hypothetical protein [Arenicellales bacterium]
MTVPTSKSTYATVAMKGGGYYSQRTRGAKDVIDNAVSMLEDAVAALPTRTTERSIQIADYGAADGGTSKQAIYRTISALRKRYPQHQVTVTYSDLPGNDYSTLFRNLTGVDDDSDDNYLKDFGNVFVNACGIGFHSQLMPDQTLDIGFSATAMHYVSDRPCQIPNHVHMVGASGSALDAFSRQARDDWNRILLSRAAELKPGGRLVFMNFGIDEDGRYLGNTGGINMFNTFNDIWNELHEEGSITHDEWVDATFSQFYRTREEFCAPLVDPSSEVYQSGLRLVSAHTGVVKCPYRAAYEAAGETMSTQEFAASYIPTLRSWSETVFATALDSARPEDARVALVDLFYQRYEDRVAADPTGHAMDYVHCYLAIEKIL